MSISHITHGPHKRSVHHLHTSQSGLDFIFRHEAKKGVSEHLHWPSGASGVTLGPGYDMKLRSRDGIVADMKAIGLSDEVAQKIAVASAKEGADAQQFCHDNKHLVTLTNAQQAALLQRTVGHYEAIVKRHIHVHLTQHEFDALVSFTYNPGASIVPVTHAINQGKIHEARTIVMSRISTGNQTSAGLHKRREDEVRLLMHGAYHPHHASHPHLQMAQNHPPEFGAGPRKQP